MNVREHAMHCEAKKHAYRQTQDGVVVSFVIHPQDVPDGIALSALGTRYMLALAEIGDDEKSKSSPTKAKKPVDEGDSEIREPAFASKKNWHEMKMSQQAGVLCNDKVFHAFLNEGVRLKTDRIGVGRAWSRPVEGVDDAAEAVRYLCLVNSRADLDKGNAAGDRWREIVSLYRAWVREPEIVG